jgi:hypothetical protein
VVTAKPQRAIGMIEVGLNGTLSQLQLTFTKCTFEAVLVNCDEGK